ncbi:MAG TPA: TauD/TfdA family dioxygenase [Roseomonas sp.]|nr:TauD/TfdA family dioxygenase [Roseomonas sp.]
MSTGHARTAMGGARPVASAFPLRQERKTGMPTIRPSGGALGASVTGIDLSRPMSAADFATILRALGEHGVLCFPSQLLEPAALRDFSLRFGSIQTSLTGKFQDPNIPEVGILSNIVENGEPIGLGDAGQDWHTDMSYRDMMGFVNVLNAHKVPRRDGRVLGNTVFANMHAAYDELDPALKKRLENATATHDFNKFWDLMVKRGKGRQPLTPEQRAKRPPSVHPVFLTHPITGKKVLYCNPGYAVRINELDEAESDRVLEALFEHQLQPRFLHTHQWTEGDLLIWDNIGTLHNAIPDYGPDEHRLMKRCQVMADKVFQPDFIRQALAA